MECTPKELVTFSHQSSVEIVLCHFLAFIIFLSFKCTLISVMNYYVTADLFVTDYFYSL